jgi:hypothetical protein
MVCVVELRENYARDAERQGWARLGVVLTAR